MAETKATGILAGKRGLVMGVANNRSIAWGIAQAARQQGAELAFTYQGDALKKRVEPLAKELDAHVVGHCDVTDGATIDAVFEEVKRLWGSIATWTRLRATSPSRFSSPAIPSRPSPSAPKS
jgi:enoyl-[acyl-carrier protein] reductase I